MKLKNKVAIITGGSRGIGFATAEKFLEEGAVVILTASSQASADKAVEKLQGRYPHATVAGTAPDLSSLESVRAAFQQVFDRFGGVDILVPANVTVKLSDMSLFGGCCNENKNQPAAVPVVYVNATALFGGVEVK